MNPERPLLFDDTIRPFLMEFMAKSINILLTRLKERNANAFMFIDEPDLQFVYSAMSVRQKKCGDVLRQDAP